MIQTKNWLSRAWPATVVVPLLTSLIAVVAASSAAEPSPKEAVKLSCEAKMVGEELVVDIRLENQDQKEIVVDRDLIFLVNIGFRDADGKLIECVRVKDDEERWRLSKMELDRRFVSLLPGKSLSRQIKPFKGFQLFEYGIAEGETEIRATGYECSNALERDRKVARVQIGYGMGHGFQEGFRAYTQHAFNSSSVWLGPAKAECVVRE